MLPSAPTPSREGEDARGTRPVHLAMNQPPAGACNTDPEPLLTPGHCSPRSRASGHRFAGPSPRVAPEKRDQLGHRSHAPATFFEVRFASLFEARCRLFVSAITRLGGMTRSSFRIPARRGPRPSSLGTVDLPCGRDAVRAGDAPSRFATPPAFSPPAPDAGVTGFPILPT
jgi:hypothetical protein